MSLPQNSVPSVKSKLINLATYIFPRDHLSVAVVSLTLPIIHLAGMDRIFPGLLHKSCILRQFPAHIKPNNLTHHPMLPSLLCQEVIFSPTIPTILLESKGRLSLHLLNKGLGSLTHTLPLSLANQVPPRENLWPSLVSHIPTLPWPSLVYPHNNSRQVISNSPTHHLQVLPVLPTPLYQITSLSLFH